MSGHKTTEIMSRDRAARINLDCAGLVPTKSRIPANEPKTRNLLANAIQRSPIDIDEPIGIPTIKISKVIYPKLRRRSGHILGTAVTRNAVIVAIEAIEATNIPSMCAYRQCI